MFDYHQEGLWVCGSCGNPPESAHPPLLLWGPAPTLTAPGGTFLILPTHIPSSQRSVCSGPTSVLQTSYFPSQVSHVCSCLPKWVAYSPTLHYTTLLGIPGGEQNVPGRDFAELLTSLSTADRQERHDTCRVSPPYLTREYF